MCQGDVSLDTRDESLVGHLFGETMAAARRFGSSEEPTLEIYNPKTRIKVKIRY
jgi:hypothetical protein